VQETHTSPQQWTAPHRDVDDPRPLRKIPTAERVFVPGATLGPPGAERDGRDPRSGEAWVVAVSGTAERARFGEPCATWWPSIPRWGRSGSQTTTRHAAWTRRCAIWCVTRECEARGSDSALHASARAGFLEDELAGSAARVVALRGRLEPRAIRDKWPWPACPLIRVASKAARGVCAFSRLEADDEHGAGLSWPSSRCNGRRNKSKARAAALPPRWPARRLCVGG